MVDTTISTPVEYKPPFRDAPLDAGKTAFSDAWVGWFTDVSDRLTLITQRVGIAEGDIAAGGGGITDGSDAPAGHIGEFMSATSGTVSLTNNVQANVISLNLTPGDWDVSGNVVFSTGSGTHLYFAVGLTSLDYYSFATFPTGTINHAASTATQRHNVTAPTVVWVVAEAGFTGTVTVIGFIRARRTR